MDALLWFDCLIYLNRYYYFMFTIANLGIWVAKNTSTVYDTPHIYRDAYVAASLCISELLKLILFKKFRNSYPAWSVFMALVFTLISVLGMLYVFLIQWPILRLELCLDIMLCVLLLSEVFYGVYSLFACCMESEY